MIDPVELRALVEKVNGTDPRAASCARLTLDMLSKALARQVLALSDEVERLNETIDALRRDGTKMMCSYERAESEAQALRERMGEIGRCAFYALTEDGVSESDALTRIAALSTTPKEKEG